MQLPCRCRKVFWSSSLIERCKLQAQLGSMRRLYACPTTLKEKASQTLVAKTSDHGQYRVSPYCVPTEFRSMCGLALQQILPDVVAQVLRLGKSELVLMQATLLLELRPIKRVPPARPDGVVRPVRPIVGKRDLPLLPVHLYAERVLRACLQRA